MSILEAEKMVNVGNGRGISILPRFGGEVKYRRMDAEVTAAAAAAEEGRGMERRSASKRYVLACVIFASLNAVVLGYDIGVMSGCIIFIQRDLHITEVQQEILIGCFSFMSLVGSLGGGRTSDAIGRKWTIGLSSIVFQLGAVLMAFAPSFRVLMVGRLLAGAGIGFGVMIEPIYIAEISPAVSRGSLTSFPNILGSLGLLLGYVSNYAFSGLSNHLSWRIMLGVGILPSVLIGFTLFLIPESPRWLVMKKRVEEARSVLMKLNENEEEVERRLAEIQDAAGVDGENDADKAPWQEILRPSPAVRRMLIAGVGIQIFHQITGIDALIYYSPTIFKDAGIKSDSQLLAATVAVGFAKTSFILVAVFLIDRLGRKPLLYVSTVGMTFCLFTLSVVLSLLAKELISSRMGIGIALLTVWGIVAFFSMGIGPICWVMSSEIYPLKLRAQGAAVGAVGNRVCSGLISMSFLSLCRAFSVAGTFFMFSAFSALSVVFIHYYVPETKGKSLEEIKMLFDDKEGEWKKIKVQLADVEHLVHKD